MTLTDTETIAALQAENAALKQRVVELEHTAAVGHTLMQHFPMGIIMTFDHELRYTDAHWTATRRGGLSRATVVGRTLHEVVSPDLCAILEPHYRAALDGIHGNAQVAFADGVYDVHVLPIYNRQNRIISGMVLAYDITDCLTTETSLRESEAKFRTLSAAAQDAIIMIDSRGHIQFWNAAAERLLGYSSAEALGQDLHRMIVPEPFYALYHQGMATFCRSGQGPAIGQTAALEALRKDGSVCPVEVSLSAVQMGGAWHGIGILRDITERKQMEAALHESERLLQNLIDHMPAAVLIKDVERRYLLVNRCYKRLVPLNLDELVGYTDEELLALFVEDPQVSDPATVAYMRDIIATWRVEDQTVLATGQIIENELHLPIDGELRTHMALKFPLYDEAGNISGLGVISTDITERKRMEAALRESEERYRALVENINDVIFTLDSTGTFIYISPVVEQMVQYTPEEIIGQPFTRFVYPEDLPDLQASFMQTLQGARQPFDFRVVSKDGRLVYIRTNSRTILADGQVVAVTGVMADITRRKEMEQALRAGETQLEAIFDHTLVGMALMDTQWNYLRINHRWADMLGYTPEEVYQGRALDVTHPADVDISRVHQQKLARGLIEHYRLEKRFIRKDGSWFWADVLVTLIRDPQGDPAFIIGTVADIHERKQTEEALRESQSLLRGFLDHSPAIMLAKDVQGQVILHNKQFQAFWHSQKPLLGMVSSNFFAQEQARTLATQDQQVLQTGQTIEKEITIPRGDTLYTYLRTVFPITDATGKIYAVGSVATDITERKQAEEALQRANADLTHWAGELERRNYEITLLSDMSDLLQICRTSDEAAAVIIQIMPQMFPDVSGALYIITASRNYAEASAIWGNLSARQICAPDECWALRRGRTYLLQDTQHALTCEHLATPLPQSTLCVPMMAQGETLGMLHLCVEQGPFPEAHQQLAVTVAEHIGLALANMQLRETLRHQAIRDPLTALFNRRYMEESLEREVQRATRHQTALGVIMLDLDHFKRFNDSFGHAAGDMLLRELGRILQSHLRREDIACRYGGEEFTLIMLDTSLDTVIQRAEQIRTAAKQLALTYRGQALGPVTLSLGIAMFPNHGTTGERLVRIADQALYRAKTMGRDCLVVGTSHLNGN